MMTENHNNLKIYTFDELIVFGLQLFEYLQSVIEEGGGRVKLETPSEFVS